MVQRSIPNSNQYSKHILTILLKYDLGNNHDFRKFIDDGG